MNDMEIKSFVIENTWLNRGWGMGFGWGNGYVCIPKDHPWYGKHYDDECYNDVEVNGGLTFSEMIEGEGIQPWFMEYMGEYVIGFDTAHSRDNLDIWPKHEVEAETERLRQQVIAAYQPVLSPNPDDLEGVL
jgi:hypothetical protein